MCHEAVTLPHKLQSLRLLLGGCLDNCSGCNVNHNGFYVAIWECGSFELQKGPRLITSADQDRSCTVVRKKKKKKRWRWRWVSCAKDDPKPSWQRCLSLAPISCLTKWPFSLHSDIMESHIMQLIYSLCRLSSVQTELGRIIPPVLFFFFSSCP